jgi:hypothetical protein
MKMSTLIVLLAVLCLLGSCKNSSNGKYDNESAKELTNSTDTALAVTEGAKLVKTAEMRLKVKDVQKSSETITQLTRNYKGIVTHHQMEATPVNDRDITLSNDSVKRISAFSTTAAITVKIPSDSLEQFMNNVGRMGIYVNMRRMDIEDKTLDYLSAKLKSDNRGQIASKQNKWKPNLKEAEAMLRLKDDKVDKDISNRRINEAVSYSVVDMEIYQSNTVTQEVIANDDISIYQISFISRIWMALANGWQIFASFIVSLANLWVFILAGFIAWMLYRIYKRKSVPNLSNI